jgi:DNA polymerase-3 subunit epsilon
VAVVLVDPDGTITERWETLINPRRDTGPTHIHGIYNADARHAPTFSDALDQLMPLLAGRVFVAHNAAFDSRFLAAELRRLGRVSPVNLNNSLCTMILSKSFLNIPTKTLASCCVAAGIVLEDAHRASADTYATAELLSYYIRQNPEWAGWNTVLDAAEATVWQTIPLTFATLTTRETAAVAASFVHRLPEVGVDATAAVSVGYVGHIESCLTGFAPDAAALEHLVSYATEHGLSRASAAAINTKHFSDLTAGAWASGTLTSDAQMRLVSAARLLGLTGAPLTAALRPPVTEESAEVALAPGSLITLTGFSMAEKHELGALIETAGHKTHPTLIKATTVLAAQDVDSLSNKGRTARRFGIPIVDEAGLRKLLGV